MPGLIWSGDDDATPQAFSAHTRLLNRLHALPFPIRARYSRFVRAIPDSCALFPIRARYSRFVRAIPDSCALFPLEQGSSLPSGANRSTHWGESLHPSASTGANRSSAGALLPDSCANFPIRARFGVWHGMCIHFLA